MRSMLVADVKERLTAPRPKMIDEILAKSAREKFRELRLREFELSSKVPPLPKIITDR